MPYGERIPCTSSSSQAHSADPRADNARHDPIEILFIAFVAILRGCKTCVEIIELAEAKTPFSILCEEVGPQSPPTTPSRPCFAPRSEGARRGLPQVHGRLRSGACGSLHLAIDGKALKGADEKGNKPLAHDGSPPITRITFPACRAGYPGEPNGCSRRYGPSDCSSAKAVFVTGLRSAGCPTKPQSYRQL
jgi:hypothetical protein